MAAKLWWWFLFFVHAIHFEEKPLEVRLMRAI